MRVKTRAGLEVAFPLSAKDMFSGVNQKLRERVRWRESEVYVYIQMYTDTYI